MHKLYVFFFQAEDGIRDGHVTGVQTCALPISIELALEDYVVSMSGDPVQLSDFASVRATNSDGSELVVDAQTLTYTSREGYYGPATITFEVTDAPDRSEERRVGKERRDRADSGGAER